MLKRITAILTAAALLLPVTGCSRKPKGSTLEIDLSTSYVSEDFTKAGSRFEPTAVTEKGIICTKYTTLQNTAMSLCDPATGEWRDFNKGQINLPIWDGQLPDGRLAAVYNVSHGLAGGWYDQDGKDRVLEIYDDDLNVAETVPFPDSVTECELYSDLFYADGKGNWLLLPYTGETVPDSIEVYTQDFQLKGKIALGDLWSWEIVPGKSGTPYMTVNVGNDMKLYTLDTDAMTVAPLEASLPFNIQGLAAGPDYELYCYNANGIYGIAEDYTATMLVDLRNSDLPGSCGKLFPLDNGEFLIQFTEDNGNYSYKRLRPRTEDELSGMKFITLAGVNLKSSLVNHVCEYNRSQTDVHIFMKDYADPYSSGSQMFDDWEWESQQYITGDWVGTLYDNAARYPEAVEDFKNDLLAGIVPDIICMDGLPYQQLSNKGLLVDYAPLLEADERFSATDYYMNLLDGLKSNGRLERLGFSFTVATAAARTDLVGVQQARTPAEYTAMIQNMPEGMDLLQYTTREAVTSLYLTGSQSSFIDRENMTCSFGSDSFVQLLELAGSVKPVSELTHSQEEKREQAELGYAYWKDHRLLTAFTITEPYAYHSIHTEDYRNEDITLVGFPESSCGNGGRYLMNYVLSMTAQSAMQDEVWEYLMWELDARQQSKVGLSGDTYATMPIRRDSFENYLKAGTIRGEFRSAASQEEMDLVREYIAGVRMYGGNDPTISAIITEEADKFFNGGQTSRQAADAIQSRCTLYLSEQQ